MVQVSSSTRLVPASTQCQILLQPLKSKAPGDVDDASSRRKVDDKIMQYLIRLWTAQPVVLQQSLMSQEQVPADALLFNSPLGIDVERHPTPVSAEPRSCSNTAIVEHHGEFVAPLLLDTVSKSSTEVSGGSLHSTSQGKDCRVIVGRRSPGQP